jgi:Ca2+-binding RTX toxin-like protein
VLKAGNNQSEAVSFTPTDTTDYNTASSTVTVNVAQAAPALSASAGPTVVLGMGVPLTASATLLGGVNVTGTITFTLYNPNNVIVYTDQVGVTGNGTYNTSSGTSTGSAIPTLAGTYQWLAAYSGDGNNKATSTAKGNIPEIAVGPGSTVVGTSLYLVGGNSSDQVNIKAAGASATGSSGFQISGNLNGSNLGNRTYSQAFTTIYMVGFGGNDTIQVASTLTIATVISEGDGSDQLQLGNGNNTITLGNGNDKIQAGIGNNTITQGNGTDNVQLGNGQNVVVEGNGTDNVQAGNGNNLIVGGLGKHTIQVGNGSNILIDGSVQLTNSDDSLVQVLNDWTKYGATTANVASILARLRVTFNTINANTMQAGSGLDWFFETNPQDHINRKAKDLLN